MVILYIAARKVDQSGLSTVIPRWRSGEGLCPVGMICAYLEAFEPLLAGEGPMFPVVTRSALKQFIIEEFAVLQVAGGGLRSPRRGGAAAAVRRPCPEYSGILARAPLGVHVYMYRIE